MRRILRKLINAVSKPFGLRLIRIYEYEHISNKYIFLVREIEALFHELIFPDIPLRKGRSNLLTKLYGTQISEALYIVHFLHKALKLKGDICEFGIANGATSALLANEIKKSKKKLWLFDSFMGLSKPTKKDILINDIFKLGSMDKYEGSMSYSVDDVKTRLKEIKFPSPKIKIVPGFIEKTVNNSILPDSVSFAYVDLDLYEPISVSLNFLKKHLVKGGIIIVDDYNFFSKGVKVAVDNFMKKNYESFTISFPHEFAGHFCILEKKEI